MNLSRAARSERDVVCGGPAGPSGSQAEVEPPRRIALQRYARLAAQRAVFAGPTRATSQRQGNADDSFSFPEVSTRIARIKHLLRVFAMLMAAGGAAALRAQDGAAVPQRAAGDLSGRISIATTSELAGLGDALAEGFRRHHPGVETRVVRTTKNPLLDPAHAEGFASVVLSHALSGQQAGAAERLQGRPLSGAVAAGDAVAVFVHRDNPVALLTLPQVDALFSADRRCGYQTDISAWRELGLTAEWAVKDVLPLAPPAGSDTSEYARQVALCGGGYKPAVKELPTGAEVVAGVASTVYGIGIAGITQKSAGARAVPIARRGTESITIGKWLIESHGIPTPDTEAYEPTPENIRLGNYPLARPVYVYLAETGGATSKLAAELVRFVFASAGQDIVAGQGYVRLPANVAADGLRRLGLQ